MEVKVKSAHAHFSIFVIFAILGFWSWGVDFRDFCDFRCFWGFLEKPPLGPWRGPKGVDFSCGWGLYHLFLHFFAKSGKNDAFETLYRFFKTIHGSVEGVDFRDFRVFLTISHFHFWKVKNRKCASALSVFVFSVQLG